MAYEAITESELAATEAPPGSLRRSEQKGFGRFWRILGPGVITGAADDDPSGIATYSQAGAQFGWSTPWMMLFTLPLMIAVQEACMRVGAVTGKGLAAVISRHYARWVLYAMVMLVVVANTLNIGADIGAMAASMQLLVPLPLPVLAVGFAVLMLVLQVFIAYKAYVKLLKWLALVLFAYFATAFMVGVPWLEALKATLVPHIQLTPEYVYLFVAILGTTISPYLFFWQASEVVEDEIASHRLAQRGGVPRLSRPYLRNLRLDNAVGMVFSNVTAWFIIVVGAVVLNRGGVTNIASAADAAHALEPLVRGFPDAGLWAKAIFALGVVGIGLLSVPVLAGSSSYAIAETFGWKEGLYRKFANARAFYLVIIASTLVGLVMNFLGLDPIHALIFAAVCNGVAAVPLIFLVALISSRRDIMGEYRSGTWSRIGLWLAWLVMLAAALGLGVSYLI
ncbi:MAG TPA: divalent metal cation transporter [Candidatus Saccharimonas sp.]|nr:divalent metal cation transporter [Candidatus Saccharimonas sp.]